MFRFVMAAFALSLSPLAATAQSATALTAYYGVKDALVATDAAAAKTSAVALSSALRKVKTATLPAADRKALATAKIHAAAIAKTTDVDTQRDHFENLSTGMIALVKATKPAPTYVQFCPMAADGKGAYWLSGQKEIKNPYYGSKMLKCGSVKEEI